MFKLFLKDCKISGEINYPRLAKFASGMSGAAIREAVIRAVQYSLEEGDKGVVNQQQLLWGVDRVKSFGEKQLGFLPGSKREEEK